jgi:hypothetical protein
MEVSLTLNRSPFIMQVGFLNSETDEEENHFDYKIDQLLDLSPFFKQDTDVYQLQAVVTVEEGVLGVVSFASYIRNSKNEWLKINM